MRWHETDRGDIDRSRTGDLHEQIRRGPKPGERGGSFDDLPLLPGMEDRSERFFDTEPEEEPRAFRTCPLESLEDDEEDPEDHDSNEDGPTLTYRDRPPMTYGNFAEDNPAA